MDRETYDRNIAVLTDAVRKARLGENDKFDALRRLGKLESRSGLTRAEAATQSRTDFNPFGTDQFRSTDDDGPASCSFSSSVAWV